MIRWLIGLIAVIQICVGLSFSMVFTSANKLILGFRWEVPNTPLALNLEIPSLNVSFEIKCPYNITISIPLIPFASGISLINTLKMDLLIITALELFKNGVLSFTTPFINHELVKDLLTGIAFLEFSLPVSEIKLHTTIPEKDRYRHCCIPSRLRKSKLQSTLTDAPEELSKLEGEECRLNDTASSGDSNKIDEVGNAGEVDGLTEQNFVPMDCSQEDNKITYPVPDKDNEDLELAANGKNIDCEMDNGGSTMIVVASIAVDSNELCPCAKMSSAKIDNPITFQSNCSETGDYRRENKTDTTCSNI